MTFFKTVAACAVGVFVAWIAARLFILALILVSVMLTPQ